MATGIRLVFPGPVNYDLVFGDNGTLQVPPLARIIREEGMLRIIAAPAT